MAQPDATVIQAIPVQGVVVATAPIQANVIVQAAPPPVSIIGQVVSSPPPRAAAAKTSADDECMKCLGCFGGTVGCVFVCALETSEDETAPPLATSSLIIPSSGLSPSFSLSLSLALNSIIAIIAAVCCCLCCLCVTGTIIGIIIAISEAAKAVKAELAKYSCDAPEFYSTGATAEFTSKSSCTTASTGASGSLSSCCAKCCSTASNQGKGGNKCVKTSIASAGSFTNQDGLTCPICGDSPSLMPTWGECSQKFSISALCGGKDSKATCDQTDALYPSCMAGDALTGETKGNCLQIRATSPMCEGGGCNQRQATNPSCAGGGCDQTGATGTPTCTGGKCTESTGSLAPTSASAANAAVVVSTAASIVLTAAGAVLATIL